MNPWYLNEGKDVISATAEGKLLFIWEAIYDDGKPVWQFEEHIVMRALADDSFIPKLELAISTSHLDPKLVKKFILHPIAFAKKRTPWFQMDFECNIRRELGEQFLGHWLTDWNTTLGVRFSRQVIGLRTAEGDFYVVVSPSGKVTLGTTMNMSYEGE
jgi:hypothetical protein